MKSRLLMFALTVLLACGTTVFAQDPGIPDTIDLELTVDTIGLTATLEMWVFSDENLTGATLGYTWGDSPFPAHFQVDTVIASSAIASGFDLGRFYYESDSKALTNANFRVGFGAASLFSNYPGDATGRRLWATYTFNITQWDGWGTDAFLVDTLTYSAGTAYLFVDESQTEILPVFTGSVFFGDPGTDAGEGPQDELPTSYALAQNYPNPFNPTTEIAFDLPAKTKVRLTVFNILGQEVATLVNGELPAGHHPIQWDASQQASGIYFYKLQAGNFSETRKMMLVK